MSGRRRRDGELAPYVDGHRQRLLALGYTSGSVCNQVAVVGHLDRWMTARGLAVDQLRGAEIDVFVAECRRPGGRQIVFRHGLIVLVSTLIEVGATLPDESRVLSALEVLTGSYRAWLLCDRGLAEATVVPAGSCFGSLDERIGSFEQAVEPLKHFVKSVEEHWDGIIS